MLQSDIQFHQLVLYCDQSSAKVTESTDSTIKDVKFRIVDSSSLTPVQMKQIQQAKDQDTQKVVFNIVVK